LAIDVKGRRVFALVADSNNQQQLVSIARNADGSPGNVSNGESLFNQKCNAIPRCRTLLLICKAQKPSSHAIL
jgi:hypothetical protein